jgi:hypothetical protein
MIMKKFRVIKYFTDLQDNSFAYHEGDLFPREGLEVSDKRIKELSTSANRRKQPLIEAIEEPVEDIPEEITEEPKEEPQEVKADESPSKPTKAKRSGKKN